MRQQHKRTTPITAFECCCLSTLLHLSTTMTRTRRLLHIHHHSKCTRNLMVTIPRCQNAMEHTGIPATRYKSIIEPSSLHHRWTPIQLSQQHPKIPVRKIARSRKPAEFASFPTRNRIAPTIMMMLASRY